MDLETSGLDWSRDEILEIGAVKVGEDGELTEYQTLVRPSREVSDSILRLTGLKLEELRQAPTLETILPSLLAFLENTTLCGYNVEFDRRFLEKACDDAGYELTCKEFLDVLQLARCLEPTERDFRLTDISRRNGVSIKRVHRALDDAQATAGVLNTLQTKTESLGYPLLQQLVQMAGLFSPALAEWFQNMADRRFRDKGDTLPPECQSVRSLVFRRPETHSEGEEARNETDRDFHHNISLGQVPLADTALALLDAKGPLARALPGFEVRSGQRQMVAAVSAALQGDEHLLVEAGTGTGKSLAYLIPAALYAVGRKAKVIIATHTVALQEQIRTRDFPTLLKILPFPIRFSVFKGRTHYVCMRKLHSDVGSLNFSSNADEIVTYMGLLVWLAQTEAGDKEEIGLKGVSSYVWPRIQSESETCINKRCPFFKPCYYFRARTQAYNANLVVTNHSLVFSDLKTDHRVLPQYDKLVLDEAHHLEEEATKHLGSETHLRQVQTLIARLVRDNQRQGILPELIMKVTSSEILGVEEVVGWLTDAMNRTRSLQIDIEEVFAALAKMVPKDRTEYRISRETENHATWKPFLNALDIVTKHWTDLNEVLSHISNVAEAERDDDLSGRMLDLIGFYSEISKNIQVLQEAADFNEQWVTWVEVRRNSSRPIIGLFHAPLDVAPLLEEMVFNVKSTVVLTSATLSVNGSFQYAKQQLGLENAERDGRLASAVVESPFHLDRQALLCVPNDVPNLATLRDAEAATWLSDSLYQLAKVSHGRVMALFTSHAMLRATAEALRGPLTQMGYRTFAQGIDGNRNQLLEAFRQFPESVLLGAQTFWEGIDLPGDQLKTLVIIRLPFTPPTHPVTEARHQLLESQGRSSFWYGSLPQAIVRFRQGFGRLIRSTTDKGAVVVFDKRIITAKYGKSFVQSLTGVHPFVADEQRVIAKIAEFFASADSQPVHL